MRDEIGRGWLRLRILCISLWITLISAGMRTLGDTFLKRKGRAGKRKEIEELLIVSTIKVKELTDTYRSGLCRIVRSNYEMRDKIGRGDDFD